ncbi:MAG TPA: DUF3592 domain-containing protein [Propionibacterium sp.]|nr:DUF3592 domain-containing protein [Propionibacterium sp.]
MNPFRVLGPILLVLALVCAGVVGWSLRPGKYDGWVETSGVVVDQERRVRRDRESGQQRVTYRIVVQYANEAGEPHEVTSQVGTNRPKPIGEPVVVRYPPGEPAKATIDNDTTWFMGLFFGIWAVVLGIIGTAMTIVGRRYPGERLRIKHDHSGKDLEEVVREYERGAEDDREPDWLPPSETPDGSEAKPWPGLPPRDQRSRADDSTWDETR